MGRDVDGVKEVNFLGMGVICEVFQCVGVRVVERHSWKSIWRDSINGVYGLSALKILICKISRPKDLELGYFNICLRILEMLHMSSKTFEKERGDCR